MGLWMLSFGNRGAAIIEAESMAHARLRAAARRLTDRVIGERVAVTLRPASCASARACVKLRSHKQSEGCRLRIVPGSTVTSRWELYDALVDTVGARLDGAIDRFDRALGPKAERLRRYPQSLYLPNT
jgi:hypothetical protein